MECPLVIIIFSLVWSAPLPLSLTALYGVPLAIIIDSFVWSAP